MWRSRRRFTEVQSWAVGGKGVGWGGALGVGFSVSCGVVGVDILTEFNG